ncbi:SMP-30/gluconolactonase/LRE family protein [Trinickia diaoshuihuensis]|uniref:SMP-30/gluconolactonase/LRE family protein n=1 Tax=Trinickia diaoshuihuensis TaxID=2292265 RepID=UPI000E25BDA9|nr:SMP-30/gluconolactonase/LRE family protein [Trinickia diaoshuihuensis]
MITPECIWPLGAELGEGPVWSKTEKAVYFVDIKRKQVHRYIAATHETMTWPAPSEACFVIPTSDETFVCGLRKGLYRFDPRTGTFDKLVDVERERTTNRLNDGFSDPRGYLWFGTMDDEEQAPTGALYRVSDTGSVERRDDGYDIANGPAMSPDGRTLYHTDTRGQTIYASDVDEDGQLSNKRVFVKVQGSAYPDGMAVDAQGCVWVALFNGGAIERYSPEGKQIDTVAFPCSNVTKLVFGGDDLRTAYVTTAMKGLTAAKRERETLAGGLFMFRSPVPGLPQNVVTRGLVRAS